MKNTFKILLAGLVGVSMVACSSQSETEDTTDETVVEQGTGAYAIYNKTGETVTDLYVYEVGSEDKGTNEAGEGMADGDKVDVEITAASDAVLILEFTTESGYTASFETLHIEEAPITLLSEDAMTGATPIAFEAAE